MNWQITVPVAEPRLGAIGYHPSLLPAHKGKTAISNNANSYNRNITITLPPEYDPTKHTVSAFTSNGTYVVNELAGTVVFTARVSSSRDGEGVVTDSMTASFKVSIVA